MDPTSLSPPSPPPSPPYPPQNPHAPTDAIIEASPFDCYQKGEPSTSRSMDNFKALIFKLARRLRPAHQSLIHRHFDEIIPDEFLVPDHPPYADMILTALWELKSEDGSSEKAISDFIEKEYQDLPWAHTTILNHHLRDLCMKGKITMMHDKCYVLCSPITKPKPSSGPSPSPPSSPDSSSSFSICSSPSSSSSSSSWDRPYTTQKRKRKRKRKNIRERGGKMFQVMGRGRGRGSGSSPMMIQIGQRGTSREMNRETKLGRCCKFKIGGESKNEITVIDVEDYSTSQDGVTARISEEENRPGEQHKVEHTKQNQPYSTQDSVTARISNEESLPCEQQKVEDKEKNQSKKQYNVTWIGRGVRRCKVAEKDVLKEQSDDDITELDDDANGAEVDEHSDEIKHKEDEATDIVEKQTLQEEPPMSVMDDKILPCDAQAADNRVDEEIHVQEQPEKGNKEDLQIHEQQKRGTEQEMLEKQLELETAEKNEAKEQNDNLTEEQVETKVRSEEQHDDVTEEPIHRTDVCLQSCGQNQLKNESAEEQPQQEEHQTEVCQKETVLQVDTEVQQEQCVGVIEEENQPYIQQPEISENKENYDATSNENSAEGQPQQEEHQTEVCQKETVLPVDTEVQQEQCVGEIEEENQPCIQQPEISENKFRNYATSNENSAEEQPQQEEHQTEVCQKETVLRVDTEVQQEQCIGVIEEENQPCIQQPEISENEEKNDATSDENSGSSGSTSEGSRVLAGSSSGRKGQDEQRHRLRRGLRSSHKKEEVTPKAKKQIERVTPVRRSLRSHKTISEAAIATEVPDRSKEQLKHIGSATPSKRKPKIAEAEQVSSARRTRRTGL